MAISMRLNTRRRTSVATTTRLPRYARNDKVGPMSPAAGLTGESAGLGCAYNCQSEKTDVTMTKNGIRHVFLAILMALGLMAVAVACGGSAESPADAGTAAFAAQPAAQRASEVQSEPAAAATAAPEAAAGVAAAVSRPVLQAPTSGDGASQVTGIRQLIIEARLGLEVMDVDAAARRIESIATGLGGWTEGVEISGEGGQRSARVRVRVPSDDVGDVLNQLRGLGRVVDEEVSASDVTDQIVDNDARLAAWKVQEERLILLLENARTVEDIVEIEKRISEVRTDIERLAASQRNLAGRVATALISVRLALPNRLTSEAPNAAMSLAVGDPAAVADAVRARVNALGGYIGNKREYQEGSTGLVVETSVFVRSTDLKALMDYVATLGVPSERNLSAVGDPPVGDAPDARLLLTIRSNSGVAASISLKAEAPDAAGELLRGRAESLGGYVERFRENRDDNDSHSVDIVLVVKSSDLRDLLDYASTIGDADGWEYNATGQQPADDAPNARLEVLITSPPDLTPVWIALGVIVGIVVVAGAVVYFTGAWRMVRGNSAAPSPEQDADAATE